MASVTQEKKRTIPNKTELKERIRVASLSPVSPELINLRDVPSDERRRVWNALPGSKFKRFQELFTRSRDLLIPQYSIDSKGNIKFKDLPPAPLRFCKVSPQRISNRLLSVTGLVTLESDKSSFVSRTLKKCNPDVINALKLLFESSAQIKNSTGLSTMSPKNLRVLVVGSRGEEVRHYYPESALLPKELVGTVLYLQEKAPTRRKFKKNSKPTSRRLKAQFFSSAPAALRKTNHQKRSYRNENGQLSSFNALLSVIRDKIDVGVRKEIPPEVKKDLVSEVTEQLDVITRKLDRVVDPKKQNAQQKVSSAANLKDSRGRVNPNVTLNSLSVASKNLSARLADLIYKGGHNDTDQAHLFSRLRYEGTILQAVRMEVNRSLKDPNHKSCVDEFSRKAPSLDRSLSKITLRPLITFSNSIRTDLAAFQKMVEMNNEEGAYNTLKIIQSTTWLNALSTSLDNMRGYISRSEQLDVKSLIDMLSVVRNSPPSKSSTRAVILLEDLNDLVTSGSDIIRKDSNNWVLIKEALSDIRPELEVLR